MTAVNPTEWYVDPTGGSDTTGDGTSEVTAWATLQKAMDTMSKSAGGDRINLKNNGSAVLTADLTNTVYGSPNVWQAGLQIRGYGTTIGDGTKATIDGGGLYKVAPTGHGHYYTDLNFTNGPAGSAVLKLAGAIAHIANCKFHNSAYGFDGDNGGHVVGCEFEAIDIIACWDPAAVIGCTFTNSGGTEANSMITVSSGGQSSPKVVIGNRIKASGGTNGIIVGYAHVVAHNSVWSSGGTGYGIKGTPTADYNNTLYNNYVEGFSGVGGIGFAGGDATAYETFAARNYAYNNTTNYSNYAAVETVNDENTLGSSGLVDPGNDDFTPASALRDLGYPNGGDIGSSQAVVTATSTVIKKVRRYM